MKALWSSFRFRIFCAVLVAALASGVIGLFSVRVFIQDRQLDDFREMLLRHTRLAAGLVQEAPDLAQGMRLVERSFDGWPVRCSVADAQGRVLLESAGGVAPESMDNHSDRPEMREAAASGVGLPSGTALPWGRILPMRLAP